MAETMTQGVHVVCPSCNAVNRVPPERLAEGPVCGKCHQPLFSGHPAELDAAGLEKQIKRSELPLVVDFWAPWCAPCRAMAPAFASAAAQLEPRVRLAKVDTEAHPGVGAAHGIRSIPTLVMFRGGREIARQSGALALPQLLQWIKAAGS